MATISSPGLGSGLDVSSIVEQLVALERRPIERLEQAAEQIKARLSSFGLLQNYLTNLRDAAAKLADAKLWSQTAATSADPVAVSASSGAGAVPGSYSIGVTQLAQAQSLSSTAFSASSAVVGSGTLHLQLGTWAADLSSFAPGSAAAIDIVIAPGENTLAAIRDKINAADAPVSASIVNDGNGARLVIRPKSSGEANALRITVTDADGTPDDAAGLSALAFDPPTAGGRMTQDLAGRNAALTINGLAISSASNRVAGAIEGVTLTLAKTTAAPVDVTVSLATDAMKKSVGDFVKAYNDINKYIAEQTRYDPDTKVAGVLQGDRSTLSVQGQLRATLQALSSASPVFGRLSALGLQAQRDGSLKIDDARLSDALSGDLDEVALAFSRDESGGRGFATAIVDLAERLTATDGTVTQRSEGLRAGIQRNEKEQDRLEERVAATRERLLRQYSALDTKLQQMNNLSAYLSQQMALWTNSLALSPKRD